LTESKLSEIKNLNNFKTTVINLIYKSGEFSLEKYLDTICDKAVEDVKNGAEILVLSDEGMS
jgi:hypothetical protein